MNETTSQQLARQRYSLTEKYLGVLSRIMVWGILFSIVYLLRSFFLLIFLTFVFAYIQTSGVRRLGPYIGNRVIRVVLVAAIFLTVLISIGLFLVPRVQEQAELFADRYPSYIERVDLELVRMSNQYPVVNKLFPPIEQFTQDSVEDRSSPTAEFIQQLVGLGEQDEGVKSVKRTIDTLSNIGGKLLAMGSAFLLALLFSFLIVLDLPKLSTGVQELAYTKLRYVYLEVAENIYTFGLTLGRALEAQLYIALLNTILTALGIYFLGLSDKIAFLSVIVFLGSFIPVAGVFISSVPICILTLQESGLQMMLIAIGLITIIHLIEAYILNPKIYGHHLRMNPVIVLIILTIGGKLFHFWGLILGVPICRYIFGYAIREKEMEVGYL